MALGTASHVKALLSTLSHGCNPAHFIMSIMAWRLWLCASVRLPIQVIWVDMVLHHHDGAHHAEERLRVEDQFARKSPGVEALVPRALLRGRRVQTVKEVPHGVDRIRKLVRPVAGRLASRPQPVARPRPAESQRIGCRLSAQKPHPPPRRAPCCGMDGVRLDGVGMVF